MKVKIDLKKIVSSLLIITKEIIEDSSKKEILLFILKIFVEIMINYKNLEEI